MEKATRILNRTLSVFCAIAAITALIAATYNPWQLLWFIICITLSITMAQESK